MPNRKRVVEVLTTDVLGAQRWNGRIGETVNMPTEDYERVQSAAEAILERLARALDFPRLLREASFRHEIIHPDYEPSAQDWNLATGVCGECLREALLAEDMGAQDWKTHPSTPIRHGRTDWPTIVAEELEHRSAAHWHPYKD
jgi:hypothetical protein